MTQESLDGLAAAEGGNCRSSAAAAIFRSCANSETKHTLHRGIDNFILHVGMAQTPCFPPARRRWPPNWPKWLRTGSFEADVANFRCAYATAGALFDLHSMRIGCMHTMNFQRAHRLPLLESFCALCAQGVACMHACTPCACTHGVFMHAYR